MEAIALKNDPELRRAFELIIAKEEFPSYVIDIAQLIYSQNLNKDELARILDEHGISNIEKIKSELLDLLIAYIKFILEDHQITTNEIQNIGFLKIYFRIKEGDFYNLKLSKIEPILVQQFRRLYSDNRINEQEALHSVGLQELFNLSYDQLESIREGEVDKAINKGANILDLDVATYPEAAPETASGDEIGSAGRFISQEVKKRVWNRDNGKCVDCGTKEKLEYDHIIPFSRGGSGTDRNIQLLCEPCNRKKSNKIC